MKNKDKRIVINDKLSKFNFVDGTVIFDKNNSTSWLNQVAIGELYHITQSRVSQILTELKEDQLIHISNTNTIGKGVKATTFYDIEAVKYIGIKTRSNIGIELQKELVELSEEYRKKGFVIKKGMEEDAYDYIQNMHAEDKNVFQVLNHLIALASDYSKYDEQIRSVFAGVRNSIYKVTTGFVASDIIWNRANHKDEFMGLTNFDGKRGPTKQDVKNAKNYLLSLERKKVIDTTNLMIQFAKTTMLLHEDYTVKDFIRQWNVTIQALNKGGIVDIEPVHDRKEANEHAVNELEKYRGLLSGSKRVIGC